MRLRALFSLLLAILLAPFFAFWAWSSIEAARLDRALDALEARNEPLDVAEFDPKPVTPDQKQASHYYAQARTLVEDVSLQELAPSGRTIEQLCGDPTARERDTRIGELKVIERRYAPALDLLDRAAKLDAIGWDVADNPKAFSEMTGPQRLAAVNSVRVARMACGGDPARAPDALLSTLRLNRMPIPGGARRLQTAHGLQSALNFTTPSPSTLRAIQHEYERAADDHGLDRALQYFRARWLSFTTPGVFSDPPPEFASRRITPFEAIAMRLSRPARNHRTVSELHEFDDVLAAAAAPWPQKIDEAGRLERKYPRPRSRGGAVTNILNPFGVHVASGQFQFLIPNYAESLARTRASIGAVAVARWRADHAGALPASLHDLVPSYISAPLIDPYSGQELKYVTGGDNTYKVYSVGRNRKDDGGSWEQHSDLQFSRRGDPLDVGIAVTAWPQLR